MKNGPVCGQRDVARDVMRQMRKFRHVRICCAFRDNEAFCRDNAWTSILKGPIMWKRFAHLSFWLGASLYFGGLVALGAIAAPSIFETARLANLSMPAISPPLEMWKQVGGEIFGNILNRFVWIEAISLLLLLIGIAVPLVTHRPIRRSAIIL